MSEELYKAIKPAADVIAITKNKMIERSRRSVERNIQYIIEKIDGIGFNSLEDNIKTTMDEEDARQVAKPFLSKGYFIFYDPNEKDFRISLKVLNSYKTGFFARNRHTRQQFILNDKGEVVNGKMYYYCK